ncbi:MAG: helix-turn-helix domain-containing protein [Tannerellaceae bacterium]|jgi:DNA-binding XRE family transcriptional regulator|nr:helix-turn-helix domain-containing protein [Tannerellaceae bacterium]
MKIYDVSAELDEYFGKEGSPSRIEAEEKALAFFAGQMVEEARKKAHITQSELAKRIGVDKSYISKIENGIIEPKFSTFYRIMSAIGCRIEYSLQL